MLHLFFFVKEICKHFFGFTFFYVKIILFFRHHVGYPSPLEETGGDGAKETQQTQVYKGNNKKVFFAFKLVC